MPAGVIRGTDAAGAAAARLDVDLRSSRFVRSGTADPRLVDPALDRAFEEVAQQVREAARAEGYAAGWAEGVAAASGAVRAEADAAQRRLDAAEARRAQDVARAVRALDDAAGALERRAVVPAEQLRDAALTAALELAAALLARELTVAESPGLDALRRALDLVPRGRPVVARLHPEDHAALAGLAAPVPGRDVTLVADPGVERGGCLADCDATHVDAQLGTALARVREVLVP
ncbi:FliH/SctL family protein [Vallicoccus soli]|uniref:FliH/SctL family protein n=1 Tax=Vallicoccus soli TaxID=2339232 RepID=UPI001403DF91|nr:FliH/SctL family protein [Vallicoccus soli]